MSSYLYRLGRWSCRRRWWVLGFWIALLVVLAVGGQAVKGEQSDAFNVPGTESQRALDLLDEKFPGSGGATARMVFAAPAGHTLEEPRYEPVVEPTIALARQVPQAVDPGAQLAGTATMSKDGTVLFADLHFQVPVEDLEDETLDALERVAEPAREAGLQVEYSGGVVSTTEEGAPAPRRSASSSPSSCC